MSINDKKNILIIDDNEDILVMLSAFIKSSTEHQVTIVKNGFEALKIIENSLPDLILLDILLPDLDGFDVARILKKNDLTKDIPIIFITSLNNTNDMIKAFKLGGVDFITKPFNKEELLARINTHIRLKVLQDELKIKNSLLSDVELHLIKMVEEKTMKIEKTTIALVNALENVNLFYDKQTGNHIKRVSLYSALIAEKYGYDLEFIKKIKLYSLLHDIGKVGIRDHILRKPEKYTNEELEIMQQHVVFGAQMLDSPEIDIIAKNIALYHHEKWDGTGYISGLAGEAIPIEARIVSIADVYDALVNTRFYKKALSEEAADFNIKENSGICFDPKLVKIFVDNKNEIIEIKKTFD